jgi:cytochrome c556
MKMKLLLSGLALALGSGYTLTSFSQVKPEVLVKERQSVMTLQWKYFSSPYRMAQGKVPYNAQVVARNAGYLDALSKMPWDGFIADTQGVKSRALPAIYSDPGKFKAAQDAFQSEVAKLVSVSKGGDEAAVKAQISAVDKACGSCHENFRQRQ